MLCLPSGQRAIGVTLDVYGHHPIPEPDADAAAMAKLQQALIGAA